MHLWHDGQHDRVDQQLGVRSIRTLRAGDREFVQTGSGNVIELKGLLLQRARTQNFITSSDFYEKPQYSKLVGRVVLPDGREAFALSVSPPEGDTETAFIDGRTHLLDRIEYIDGDGPFTLDFSDYRVAHGMLVAYKVVQSDGDHEYDITQTIDEVIAGKRIAPQIFAPFIPSYATLTGPVTVPLREENSALYVEVTIHGQRFQFLIDSGSQGVVLDSHTAGKLAVLPEGALEVRGATRTGGVGAAALDSLQIGAASLPVRSAAVLDLHQSTAGRLTMDGILGFPLFASAEVRIDYSHLTMTIAQPGSLPVLGTRYEVDTDRELVEIPATVNGTQGRFMLDTGNGNELLLFHNFLHDHASILPFNGAGMTNNFGVGGATVGYAANIDELDIGSYKLYNRQANVVLSERGAFADRFDAGNIGLGILKNFVMTFDIANRAVYLAPDVKFNDGRDRHV